MTPYELVTQNYAFPFTGYPFQVEDINDLAERQRTGLYWEPGLGKTFAATVCALHHKINGIKTTICILPPILVGQWARWLAKVKPRHGDPLKIVCYRGTPKQRKEIKLEGDFILMSIQIFKKDIERITHEFAGMDIQLIVDEAHALKDVGTNNYKSVRDFSYGRVIQLLTGTPLNNPMDAYAYVKFTSPDTYRNLAQFTRIHVEEKDFFDNPVKFCNLELLRENLLLNASRRTKEEVLLDLPECTIVPLEYDLEPAHMKLYRQLVNDQLLKLPDGDKLDVTQATALYNALAQVVMQWHYFARDDSLVSAGYELIDEVLDELGDKKLVVFAYYKRTNCRLVERYGCPGIWGDVSAKDKDAALEKFLSDDECRMLVLQSRAQGIDGIQHVCSDALYVEPPIALSHWTQSLSRVHREGQKSSTTIRMATAIGTIQERVLRSLMAKEELISPLQGNKVALREALLGGK